MEHRKGRPRGWKGSCGICGLIASARPATAVGTCCSMACYSKRRRLAAKGKKLSHASTQLPVQSVSPISVPEADVIIQEGDDFVLLWSGLFQHQSAQWQAALVDEVLPLYPPSRATVMYGIRYPRDHIECGTAEPRDALFFGDPGVAGLKYAAISREALPLTPVLEDMRKAMGWIIQALPRQPKCADLNSVLVNHYKQGRDYMGKHNDASPAGGSDPFIASLSLGCMRPMCFNSCDPAEKCRR